VFFHTLVHRVGAGLPWDKKLPCPQTPFHVGSYSFKDAIGTQAEIDTLVTLNFGEERFHRHDPLGVVSLLNFNEDLYLGQVVPMGF
jgi:hypothetical protein